MSSQQAKVERSLHVGQQCSFRQRRIEQSRQRQDARALLADEDDPTLRASLELAELVREIARAGEQELAACRDMLRAFAEYLRSRPN